MTDFEPREPRRLEIPAQVKSEQSKPKKLALSKNDPDYFSKIGKISAAKRKISRAQFAEWAKKSHPRPGGYKGGRPKKVVVPPSE